jgi:hypothetical protein
MLEHQTGREQQSGGTIALTDGIGGAGLAVVVGFGK